MIRCILDLKATRAEKEMVRSPKRLLFWLLMDSLERSMELQQQGISSQIQIV